jgi:hypothetical protein
MLHPEDIQRFRAMTPAERLRIALHLRAIGWRFLLRLSKEEAQRRLDCAREPWNPPRPSEGAR